MKNTFNSYGYSEVTNGLLSNTLRQKEIDDKQNDEIKKIQSSGKIINVELTTNDINSEPETLFLVPTEEIPNTETLSNKIKEGALVVGNFSVSGGSSEEHMYTNGIIFKIEFMQESVLVWFSYLSAAVNKEFPFMQIIDPEPDEGGKSSGGYIEQDSFGEKGKALETEQPSTTWIDLINNALKRQ